MKKITLICLLAAALMSTGCLSSSRIVTVGNNVAKTGVSVTEELLKCYDLMGDQSRVDKDQQDLVRLLSYPNAKLIQLPATKGRELRTLPSKRSAFESLLSVYSSFQTLTGGGYKDGVYSATSSLIASYSSISKLPGLSSTVQNILPGGASELTLYIQSNKIKEQNIALSKLSSMYLELWKKDLPIWKDYVNRIYSDYSNAISNIPNARFDPRAVKQMIDAPYTGNYLISYYKLKVRNDAARKIADINGELDGTTYAFESLVKSHGTLSQDPVSLPAVTAILESIDNVLGKFKK